MLLLVNEGVNFPHTMISWLGQSHYFDDAGNQQELLQLLHSYSLKWG